MRRRLSLGSLVKKVHKNSRLNFTRLLMTGNSEYSYLIGPMYQFRRGNMLNNYTGQSTAIYKRNSRFHKGLVRLRKQQRFENEKIAKGYRRYLMPWQVKKQKDFAESLKARLTKNWTEERKLKWRFRDRRSRGVFYRENFVLLSPRVKDLSRVYTNLLDEHSLIHPTKAYSPQFSKFVRLRNPSWFLDGSKNFFSSFKRRFFSLSVYLNRPRSKYYGTIYDHLSDFMTSSAYSRELVTRCFLRRNSSSARPALKPLLAFNTIFKRLPIRKGSKISNRLFEFRRADYLKSLKRHKRLKLEPFRLFKLSKKRRLKRYRVSDQGLTLKQVYSIFKGSRFDKKRFKRGRFKDEKRKPIKVISLKKLAQPKGLKKDHYYGRRGQRGFKFDKFRGKKRLFKASRFTNKDYMDVLLNRNKKTRGGRKTPYRLGLEEKRKLKFFYGFIAESSFKSLYKHFRTYQNDYFFRFLRSMESRLFMVLVRSGFFNSMKLTKQLVLHSHIRVNGIIVSDYNYVIRKGVLITFDINKSTLHNNRFKASWVNRKIVPRSNMVISYKLPAIIISDDLKGLEQISLQFRANLQKLNSFYKI
jgi:ribosomal protein S4